MMKVDEREIDMGRANNLPLPHGHMVYEHICTLADTYFASLPERRNRLQSTDDLRAYAGQVRETFRKLLKVPSLERTPLRPRVVSVAQRDGYRVENVVFESRPAFLVSANLYVPTDVELPAAGVLHPLGHSWLGKAFERYQRAAITLVKAGFVVLNYDPIGQAERVQYWDPHQKITTIVNPLHSVAVAEHEYAGMQSLLTDVSIGGLMLWDAVRALDYLASRPEVDASRLGCTGVSGGGVLTTYLTAFDERIRVAAPLCYITTRERWLRRNEYADAEQVQDDVIKEGIDHPELCLAAFPRPLLIGTATEDFFPVEGAQEAYEVARRAYGLAGYEDRVSIVIAEGPHGFHPIHRVKVAEWFRRWLYDDPDPAVPDAGAEAEIAEPDELYATPGGQSYYGGSRTVFHFTRDQALKLRKTREKPLHAASNSAHAGISGLTRAQETVRQKLRSLLRLDGVPVLQDPVYDIVETHPWQGGYSLSRLLLQSEPGITLHAAYIRRGNVPPDAPTVVYAAQDPIDVILQCSCDFASSCLRDGLDLFIVELRGLGSVPSTPPKMSTGYRRMGVEGYHFYNYGMVGRNLLGCRVLDLWTAIRTLRHLTENEVPVRVYGHTLGGMVALFAAALDPSINEVVAERSLVSYEMLATTEFYHQPPGILVPGILTVCDLPDVSSCVAPRPLTLRNLTDSMGRIVLAADVEEQYGIVRTVYEAFGRSDALTIEVP